MASENRQGNSAEAASNVPKIYQMYVKSEISNRFSHTTITSKVKNIASKAQEATFSVVLPETAFISSFVMEIDGKKYTAYVKEKEEAKKNYDQAVASGFGAAHVAVSARDSNRFTVSVNVEPESEAVFYLSYEQLLNRQDGRYEQVINLHPGQLVKDLRVEVIISESRKIIQLKTPPLRSGNEIGNDKADLDSRAEIEHVNDTTAIIRFVPNLERQKQLAKLLGTDENNGLAGQFVVQYDVERDSQGGEILIQDGYFVHFFAPSDLVPLPKHIVFVLDTSSSMYDQKIGQLKEAMHKILEQLHDNDLFHLVEFNTNVKVWNLDNSEPSIWYPSGNSYGYRDTGAVEIGFENFTFPKASHANADNIKKAKITITAMVAHGGTDIHTALKVGLHLVELAKEQNIDNVNRQPIVVFLTDGEPTVRLTSTEEITNKICEFNIGSRKSPIFTLSFGAGADKSFLQKLALRNSGFSKHIYEAADASLQLQDFYKQISSPLLANVTFKYEPSVTSLTTIEFPIYFGGSELVVAGWCGTIFNPPMVCCWGINGEIIFKPIIKKSVSSMERLWAYLTVKQLLEKKEAAKQDKEELKKKALDLALKYSFVTSVSSLVVVKPNTTDALNPEEAAKAVQTGGAVFARSAFCATPRRAVAFSGPPSGVCNFSAISSTSGALFGASSGGAVFGGRPGAAAFGGSTGGDVFGGRPGAAAFGGSTGGAVFGGPPGAARFGGYTGRAVFGGPISGTGFGAVPTGAVSFGASSGGAVFGAAPTGGTGFGAGPTGAVTFGASSGGAVFGAAPTGGIGFGAGPTGGAGFGGGPSTIPAFGNFRVETNNFNKPKNEPSFNFGIPSTGFSIKPQAPFDNNLSSANQGQSTLFGQSELPYEEIHEKLLSFFQSGTSFDDIIKWITTNVGKRVRDKPFIRTLATACFKDSIVNLKLKPDILQGKYNLLHHYVQNNPAYELECLYALQALINKLQHPQGLLLAIFDKLYHDKVFLHASFIAWECSKDPVEQEGKVTALKQLISFFTQMKEAEEDSSSSEDL